MDRLGDHLNATGIGPKNSTISCVTDEVKVATLQLLSILTPGVTIDELPDGVEAEIQDEDGYALYQDEDGRYTYRMGAFTAIGKAIKHDYYYSQTRK